MYVSVHISIGKKRVSVAAPAAGVTSAKKSTLQDHLALLSSEPLSSSYRISQHS